MKIIMLVLLIMISLNARDWKKFTSNIELKSDSKIQIDNKNMLYSNRPIYGIYHSNSFLNQNLHNGVFNITCGTNKRMYKVVNECYMLVNKEHWHGAQLDLDKSDVLYLSKSDSKNMQSFNYKDHVIECKYSKEHGVMHNCMVKIDRFLFKYQR